MRHFRTDVSHRIRRRRPSIFSVWWFRLLLAVGLVIIVGLVVGPPVAGWFWSGVTRRPASIVTRPPITRPTLRSDEPAPPLAERTPGASDASPRPSERNGTTTATTPGGAEATPKPSGATAVPAEKPPGEKPPTNSGVYRVQVGAFLDHRNADRLVERLRTQKLEVVDSFIEQSRVLYRVIALTTDGESYGTLVERLRQLGHAPELLEDGAAVTGPVPLHGAVETARELRAQGIATRLQRQVGAASFRVVRVGEYATAAEAERLRAELAAQGLEGFVVRER